MVKSKFLIKDTVIAELNAILQLLHQGITIGTSAETCE